MHWITKREREAAERESLDAIEQTCPTLDEQEAKLNDAVATAIQTIKDKATYPFRKALIDAIADKNAAEKEAREAKQELERVQRELEEYKQATCESCG
jgi:hypothetical protein